MSLAPVTMFALAGLVWLFSDVLRALAVIAVLILLCAAGLAAFAGIFASLLVTAGLLRFVRFAEAAGLQLVRWTYPGVLGARR